MGNKNLTTTKYIFYLSLILFFSHCVYKHMTFLSQEDLKWVNNIQYDKTIIFKSNWGNTDTIKYKDKRIDNDNRRIYISDNYYDVRIANGRYEASISNDDKSSGIIPFYFSIKMKYEQNYPTITILFYNMSYKMQVNNKLTFSNFDVDNIKYRNCLIIDELNSNVISPNPSDRSGLKRFVYSQDIGLVSYEFNNGEKFVISQND